MSTVPVNNTNQMERGTAHPIGSTGHHGLFHKSDNHNTTHPTTNTSTNQFAKEGMHANTGAGDTYGHSDTIVKTGQYATGLENNTTTVPLRNTAHLPSSVSGSHNQAVNQPINSGLTGTAAHLPAGTAVPIVGGHENIRTGVNNVPTAGPQFQNTVPNAANRDGLVVNDGLGGPLGGAVVLGGQCECLANGGACSHGAGRCVCRGCTSQSTTVNPGINIGVSTAQYTAPAHTSGLGGGVGEHGTGIAGLVQPNALSQRAGNCTCIQKDGVCKCKNGVCTCSNCKSHSTSMTGHHADKPKEHHGLFGHHSKDNTTHHSTATNTAAATTAATTVPVTQHHNSGLSGMMHHNSKNVDGDGHHALNNQGLNNQGIIGNTNTVGTDTHGAGARRV